ncbi:hypothetical protein EDC61_1182 [Sulfuritortus calidifontis]|uniref:Uncharacterized protein n=1 Tax=Sulfuritortus calidifontis TaxID=1914471 RepID=A0A4R3JS52_9PROT|nr:hypothetical protein [Sulfuritortus calidifontis]TCS69988.1 hypothetical protein EDC61_1182 [Sulfuritortus calidifontis]
MIVDIDIASRVSPALSHILEAHANDPDALQPATLGSVHDLLASGEAGERYAADRLHPETARGLMAELDELIEEFGADAPAADFVSVQASEALSRVIQEVLDHAPTPPTLGKVQEAMANGLVARLVGEGVLEDDEDDTLQAELEELIARYSPDAPAEPFIAYQ